MKKRNDLFPENGIQESFSAAALTGGCAGPGKGKDCQEQQIKVCFGCADTIVPECRESISELSMFSRFFLMHILTAGLHGCDLYAVTENHELRLKRIIRGE
jgi:hypothetical protein